MADKTLVLNISHYPEDHEFEVPGLGVFTNGTHVVTDAQVAQWESMAGFHWPSGGTLTLPQVGDALVPIEVAQVFDPPSVVDLNSQDPAGGTMTGIDEQTEPQEVSNAG